MLKKGKNPKEGDQGKSQATTLEQAKESAVQIGA